MADNEKEILSLDLDSEEFKKKIGEAIELIKNLGSPEHLSGLLEGLTTLGITIGVLGGAFLAAKSALDMTLEAESIKRVNDQFELLTKNAGISTATLKEGLVEAAGGLVDDTDLMRSANEQIIKMGASAAKLPEIMELARKATQVMGGDLVSNFDRMSTAIATGQSRALKQMGIFIDSRKAVKDYAESVGVAANELSEAGRRQAMMNAALEAGKSAYEGVTLANNNATTNLQRMKVMLSELGETIVLVFDKLFGDSVRKAIELITSATRATKGWVEQFFGPTGMSSENAKNLDLVNEKIASITGQMEKLTAKKSQGLFDSGDEAMLTSLESKLKALTEQKEKLTKREPASEGGEKGGDEDAINYDQRKKNALKFYTELAAIEKSYLTARMQEATTMGEMDALIEEQKILVAEENANKIKKIQDDETLNDEQKNQLILSQQRMLSVQLAQIENDRKKHYDAVLDSYVEKSKSVNEGVSKAFQAGALKNKNSLTDWGKTGKVVFDSFAKNSTNALQEFGAGTKSAADAAKGFLFGMIADTAEAKGKELMLSGLWPPNPLAIGAGAALVALSGFLRSQGGGGSSVGGGGAPASGVAPAEGFGTRTDTPPTLSQQVQARRSVNINIQGNYLDTDASRRLITDMVRQESDATDFTIAKVGGGI